MPGVYRQDYAPEALKNKVVTQSPQQSGGAGTSGIRWPGVFEDNPGHPA
jgi:hypothetical protein